MGRRFIKVDRPMVPRLLQQKSKDVSQTTRPAGCRTIFVKNLPYDIEEKDVVNAFMFCGKIANVSLPILLRDLFFYSYPGQVSSLESYQSTQRVRIY